MTKTITYNISKQIKDQTLSMITQIEPIIEGFDRMKVIRELRLNNDTQKTVNTFFKFINIIAKLLHIKQTFSENYKNGDEFPYFQIEEGIKFISNIESELIALAA
jgi:hypothetical protein